VFEELLRNLAMSLRRQGIPYMIIGGQALLLYGEPRFTRDIHVTLGVGLEGLGKVKGVVEQLGLRVAVEEEDEFIKRTMVLPAEEPTSGVRVDFIFSYSTYEKEAIGRAQKKVIDGEQVNFASVEDLVIHKVVAGRARDLEDIRSILKKPTEINDGYIMKWLRRFDESLGERFLEHYRELRKEMEK